VIDDPLKNGLADYARRLRAGHTTVTATVEAYAERIAALDGRLQAWQHLDLDRAMDTARALDVMIAGGHDFGPLTGVPIGVKDIIAVSGLPTTNGSLYPSEDLTGPEGTIIKRLKQAGCVILGKTRTVEFALGATGVNEARGTPVNPWDAQRHRIPGGSSSGSAVATAAGMCAFALGTDTGGSVRIPACFNNLYGHKTTVGLWPTDGVFPLSPTLDSIGPLCRTADDAAIVHRVVTGQHIAPVQSLAGLRRGRPGQWCFDELDADTHDVEPSIDLRQVDFTWIRQK
jgi:aspartyl-tRNA(Asn)/glutamyl-tRNA(Gln) amidotransferase subunit A